MDTLTRRRFLVASGMAGAAATGVTLGWADLHRSVAGTGERSAEPILVLVTLYGGNDGLSTLVPYADPAYHDARPDLAYTAEEVHPLGDGLGLNPSMTGFASLWQRKQLAVVRGVGYPKPDLSHFRSMDIWQTASPTSPAGSGWLGRWLDVSGEDPLRVVNIGSVLPPLAVGARSTAAALDPGRAQPLPEAVATTLAALGTADSSDPAAYAAVRGSFRDEKVTAAAFDRALSSASPTAAPAATGGQQDDLRAQLDAVALCVKAGIGTRAYCVSLGGFDTHADEKGTQSTLIGTVDAAVSRFVSGLAGDPHGNNVVVVVYSEFGRRVAANASDGTDHGTASPVFVAGPRVNGGFYGEQPSLTDLDDGDLKYTVDFRAVYGEVLHKVLGTDPSRVLDTVPKELGFLS